MSKSFAAIAILALILGFGGCVNGCYSNYSQGERAGTVVKLSRKGLVFKSWEGEANLGGMVRKHSDQGDSFVPNLFPFSVRDPGVVAKLNAAMEAGKPVRLVYREWLVGPIRQSTSYEIVEVK